MIVRYWPNVGATEHRDAPKGHIRLGDTVFSRDDRKLNTVARLILADWRHCLQFLLQRR